MTELTSVGAECQFQGCSKRDFLPWCCDRCGHFMCQQHSKVHHAQCSVTSQPLMAPIREERNRVCCAASRVCAAPAIMRCSDCGWVTCVAHRHHVCLHRQMPSSGSMQLALDLRSHCARFVQRVQGSVACVGVHPLIRRQILWILIVILLLTFFAVIGRRRSLPQHRFGLLPG